MLDVHPPHSRIHGIGEFFLHLFTITVGLLIAVGIEGAATRHEHRKLAQEATDSLTAEIRRNLASTQDALKSIEKQQATMKANLAALAKIQENPKSAKAQDTHIDASFGSATLESTAWRTAQATGALSYMPYERAQKFSGIYDQVQSLEKSQEAIMEDEAQFFGILHRYTTTSGDLSKEEADAMAERFGIWQGHLFVVHIAARVLEEREKAFLENREPSRHMSERMGN
jgi:hypothetical protein